MKARDGTGMTIHEEELKSVSMSPDSVNKRKKNHMAHATIDPTGDAELKLMKEEAIHRRAQDERRLELEERYVTVAEAIGKRTWS